jgi:hypothetical protein
MCSAEPMAQFSPTERCPAYGVPEVIAAAVSDKQRRDDIQTAELISRGIPTFRATTGIDGGMHPIFLEALRSNGGPGATIRTASGSIPGYVKPPAEPAQIVTGSVLNLASDESTPISAPRSSAQVASAGLGSGNLLRSKSQDHASAARNVVEAFAPNAKPATSNPTPPAVATAVVIRPVSELQPVNIKPASALGPMPASAPSKRQANAEPRSTPESATTVLLTGAAPSVPAGSFGSRPNLSR